MNRPFNLPVTLPKGPEHYWAIARKAGPAGITVPELAGCTNGVAYKTVKNWVRSLANAGALKAVGSRPQKGRPQGAGKAAILYAVAIRSAAVPVCRRDSFTGERGQIQQQLWTAMRTLPAFGTIELAASASTDTLPVKPRTAEEYVRRLTRAGLLAVLVDYAKGKPGATGARAGTWRLKSQANTGPLAPKVFSATFVFDANRQRMFGEAEVSS